VPTLQKVQVPDIGDFQDVEVIDILVSPGDNVAVEDSLITLESDKASMDIPSPFDGIIKEIVVAVGSLVSEGSVFVIIETEAAEDADTPPAEKEPEPTPTPVNAPEPETSAPASPALITPAPEHPHPTEALKAGQLDFHAGPAVRKLARDLGVNLNKVVGSGRRGRITSDDIEAFVKQSIEQKKEKKQEGFQMPPAPVVDFGKFGEIEVQPMKRIQKISARNLHRNWITIPHVTHFDNADITDLEDFRKKHNEAAKEKADRLTLMPFLFKTIVSALKKFPVLNASLDSEGENLILKKYFHVGMAVDTENGLIVPVIRDVDQKSLQEIAGEMRDITIKSRTGGIKREDMQGGCFTISNLGGIGGTGFTPIVNAPEVAILGVPRAAMQPTYQNGQFTPRLILPLALSYDHRVLDGALAARVLAHICELLTDIRKML
jgi:pyruvate dehydrogenase E2 component (dihydrolipoyllysine-residue acetyltransferase)